MAFPRLQGKFKYPDDFDEFEGIMKKQFKMLFGGEYGVYGRSFVLEEFGMVYEESGYLVKRR